MALANLTNVTEIGKTLCADEETEGDISLRSPFFHQCFKLFVDAGKDGLSIKELQFKTGLDFYTVRSIVHNLNRRHHIDSYVHDCGRQRFVKYYAQGARYDDVYEYLTKDREQTMHEFPKCDLDTLSFIADTLEIDVEHLQKEPSRKHRLMVEHVKKTRDELAGKYELIAELRKKCRRRKNDEGGALDSAQILDNIYQNDGQYVDMDKSREYGLLKRLPVGGTAIGGNNPDFKKVCFEVIKGAHENADSVCKKREDLVNDSDNNGLVKFDANCVELTKAWCPPQRILGHDQVEITQIRTLLMDISIPKATHVITPDYKVIIKECNLYLRKLVDAKGTFQWADDALFSDDDDEKEVGSQDLTCQSTNEIGSVDDEDTITSRLSRSQDFVEYLIKCFERPDFSVETPLQMDFDTSVAALPSTSSRYLEKRKLSETDNDLPICKRTKLEQTAVDGHDVERNMPEPSSSSFSNAAQTVVPNEIETDVRLGPKPILVHSEIDENRIHLSIYRSSKPEDVTQEFDGIERNLQFMNRANYITDLINNERCFTDIGLLHALVHKHEWRLGKIHKICRKSLSRVMIYLIKCGRVRTMKISAHLDQNFRMKMIVYHPDYNVKPLVTKFVEQMKLSFSMLYVSKPMTKKDTQPEQIMAACNVLRNIPYRFIRPMSTSYGWMARFARLRLLHEYLVYLLYDYSTDPIVPVDKVTDYLWKYQEDFDGRTLSELSAIYKDEIDWKMFLPPLPNMEHHKPGCMLLVDILLIMPLSVYTKLFVISFHIPELHGYLNHPVKKHILIKNLPIGMRKAFFYRHKSLLTLRDMLMYLCYMGLAQHCQRERRYSDQVEMFINRHALLFDTTTSEPGYVHITPKPYPKLRFTFNTIEDVREYWAKLWYSAMHTKLGKRKPELGRYVTIQPIAVKAAMIRSYKAITYDEALRNDVGYIPGDGLGACGLDSACWVHLKQNWNWSHKSSTPLPNTPGNELITGTRKRYLEKIKAIKFKELAATRGVSDKTSSKMHQSKSTRELKKSAKATAAKRALKKQPAVLRKIAYIPRKKTALYLDERDRMIQRKRGKKTRSTWTSEENELLLLCLNVLNYLGYPFHKRVVTFVLIRDIFNALLPHCEMKLSRAYQRRLIQLKKKEETRGQMNNSDSKLLQLPDTPLHKYFKKFREEVAAKTHNDKQKIVAFIYALDWAARYCRSFSQRRGAQDGFSAINLTQNMIDQLEVDTTSGNSGVNIYRKPNADKELHLGLVKDVIITTFNSPTPTDVDKLFGIYQRFSDSDLKLAVTSLKKDQILTSQKEAKSRAGIVFAGRKQHLSYSYILKHIPCYPHVIFKQAWSYLRNLREADGRETLFELENFEQGHGVAMNEHYVLDNLHFRFKVDDEILMMDPNVTDYQNLVNELMKRYKRVMSLQKLSIDNKYMQIYIPTNVTHTDNSIRDYIKSVIEESSQNAVQISDGRADENKRTRLTDLAFLLTKGLFPDLDDEGRLQELNNCFTVSFPKASLEIADTRVMTLDTNCVDYQDLLSMLERECIIQMYTTPMEEVINIFREKGLSNSCIASIEHIIKFVRDHGKFGVSNTDLKIFYKYHYERLSDHLLEIVETLLELNVIFKVGVTEITFVDYEHAGLWYLPMDKHPGGAIGSNEPLKMKIMPWICANGSINHKCLQNWLKILLTHCIEFPCTNLRTLADKFEYLKPVDIGFLLECLQEIKCGILCKYVENDGSETSTLFSDYRTTAIAKGNVNVLDSLDDIFIETAPIAVTMMTKLLGQEHCAQDAEEDGS